MPRCGGGCSTKIAAEHQRSINAHKLITGQDNLLADNPGAGPGRCSTVSRTWEPLNHLQVEPVAALPAPATTKSWYSAGILLTMNGFWPARLRNSG